MREHPFYNAIVAALMPQSNKQFTRKELLALIAQELEHPLSQLEVNAAMYIMKSHQLIRRSRRGVYVVR